MPRFIENMKCHSKLSEQLKLQAAPAAHFSESSTPYTVLNQGGMKAVAPILTPEIVNKQAISS